MNAITHIDDPRVPAYLRSLILASMTAGVWVGPDQQRAQAV